jgi:predicted nucleic acid-binding protein
MQKQLGQLLLDKLLMVYEIQESDYSRLLELMEQYRDRPMDLADATLVLVAEKTGDRQILTLDSDFLFYRIGNRETFDVIQVP